MIIRFGFKTASRQTPERCRNLSKQMRHMDEPCVADELNSAQQESKLFGSQPLFPEISLSDGTLVWWLTNESPSVWPHLCLYGSVFVCRCRDVVVITDATRLVNEPCFIRRRVLLQMDFCNVETGALLWLLHCRNHQQNIKLQTSCFYSYCQKL